MNSHLSSDQICKWLAGERGTEEELHLLSCTACRSELDQFQHALTGFRTSVEGSSVPPVNYARTRQIVPRWILATAALAVALVLSAPVYWNARQQRSTEQSKTDELLLERVNAGLSRTVHSSMEPLMQLISNEEK